MSGLPAVERALAECFSRPPYTLGGDEKRRLLAAALGELTCWHADRCDPYARVVEGLFGREPPAADGGLDRVPYLPVRLFKLMRLASVPEAEVFKTLLSSGTTGQTPSQIVLDRATAQLQTKALAAIVGAFLGRQRLPMVIVDSPRVLKDRDAHTARGAGILGMSVFGREHFYALDDEMRLRRDALAEYLAKHAGQPVFFFGFTFMVWQHLVEELRAAGPALPAGDGVLFHGGGWKGLAERAVDNERFKAEVRQTLGIARVHNFYGMVEQVGSIFVECEAGRLHAPHFAEVLVRGTDDWSPLPPGAEGAIQVQSILPQSYPGHSLLTEDLGVILGADDCPCGRAGTTFAVRGRIPQAELRGCSDTYAEAARVPA